MTNFKANQSREKSALEVASILNNCKLLLRLEVENKANKMVLQVVTDSVNIQYTEVNTTGMLSFLFKLKEYAENKGDIDELLDEVKYLEVEWS
ncbi:hypothetical protein M5W68_21610 [Paenibacillus larvae]|uniref:hypothetical protein n=1 Tax=Paenibacillus larvae TaxID=1464 RepID=UPI0022804189|nr:hypothetical protein [Paenibacillus larvae]MCY9511414.1 hypothetical protein [Paenibacillus larvae]MCY9527617.1 hypothetical protein [Paenibacillus larvae]